MSTTPQVDPSSNCNQFHSPESMISRPSQDTLPRVREQLPDLNRTASLSDKSVISTSGSPLPFQQLLTRDSKGESVSQTHQNILNGTYRYRELEHNTSDIWCMKITGNHLIIGSSGVYNKGTCRIWDINSFKFIGELEGHRGQVRCLEIRNGKIIYTGSHDNTCRIWDLNTRECLGVIVGHTDSITCLKVVNEKWMITGSHDKTCKVWDLNTLECLHTLEGHPHPIDCIDANEDRIVTVSFEVGTCKEYCCQTWDMHSGKLLSKIEGRGAISCVKILQKEFITAGSAYNHTCQVWDLETGACKKTFRPQIDGALNCMEVMGSLVILAGANQWMSWDRETDKVIISEKQENHVMTSMEIADGLVFTGAHWDNAVKIWDIKTGKCLQTLKNAVRDRLDGIRCLAYQNGKLVSGSGENPVRIRNFSAKEIAAQPTLLSPEELNIKSLQNIADGLAQGQRSANIEYSDVEELPSLLNSFSILPIEMRRGVSSLFFQQICVTRFSAKERDLLWAENVFLDPSLNDPQINQYRARAISGYLKDKNLKA